MAVAIRDIATADSYTGNAGIGGSIDGVINIDTRPIQQLAQYTFYANREAYQQKQRDAEAQAKQIADITAYDLNSAIPKDRTEIQKKYNDLYEYVQKNPTVVDYKKNPTGWMEYNKKKSEFANDLSGAKQRSILYLSRMKDITDATDPKTKELLKTELNEEANSTDLRTPLLHAQKYDESLPEMPKATGIKIPVAIRNGNDIFDEEHEVWNARAANDKGNVFGLGLNDVVDETTPEGKRKAIAKKNNFWLQGAEVFNETIASSKNADGTLDESKMKGIAKDLVGLANRLNAYNAQKVIEIKAGKYGSNLKAEDYAPINYADGISPNELAVIADFSTWKGDNVGREIVITNDAKENADREAANYRARLNEQGANYRAKLPYDERKKDIEATTTFGNLIYGVNATESIAIAKGDGGKPLSGLKLQNGALVDNQGNINNYSGDLKIPVKYFDNSILTEYNKYVTGGKAASLTDALIAGNMAQSGVTPGSSAASKLKVSNGQFTAKMINGVISGIYTEDGTVASDNQFAHITLSAGQSGATKYKRPDTDYGVQSKPPSSGNVTKSVSASTIKGLVGTKGYEGYTESELINYYKSNGYTVQ